MPFLFLIISRNWHTLQPGASVQSASAFLSPHDDEEAVLSPCVSCLVYVLELVDSLRTPASQPCPEVPACANCPFCPKPVPRFGHRPQLDAAFLFSGLIAAAITSLQSREAGDYIAGPAARFELPRHDGRSGRNANHSRRQRGRRRLRRRSGAVWPLGVDAWKQHACAVAARKLTHEEWSRFITGAITEARARAAESNGRSRYVPRARH